MTAAVAVLVLVAAAAWFVHYKSGLRPRLVLVMPARECGRLSFSGRWGLTLGSEVLGVCRENGVSGDHLFALRGHRAVRFGVYGFDSNQGSLEVAKGDNDTVYFYSYQRRYHRIVENVEGHTFVSE